MGKRRILITGGAGFLGSHLCERFLAEGYEVVCMDNLITGDIAQHRAPVPRADFHFEQRDVTEYVAVRGTLDAILHFASPAEPDRLPRAADPDAQGRVARHAQGARPRAGQGRALPARLDLRVLRRSRWCTRSARTTGATSTRSARAACTTRPSASPRP